MKINITVWRGFDVVASVVKLVCIVRLFGLKVSDPIRIFTVEDFVDESQLGRDPGEQLGLILYALAVVVPYPDDHSLDHQRTSAVSLKTYVFFHDIIILMSLLKKKKARSRTTTYDAGESVDVLGLGADVVVGHYDVQGVLALLQGHYDRLEVLELLRVLEHDLAAGGLVGGARVRGHQGELFRPVTDELGRLALEVAVVLRQVGPLEVPVVGQVELSHHLRGKELIESSRALGGPKASFEVRSTLFRGYFREQRQTNLDHGDVVLVTATAGAVVVLGVHDLHDPVVDLLVEQRLLRGLAEAAANQELVLVGVVNAVSGRQDVPGADNDATADVHGRIVLLDF